MRLFNHKDWWSWVHWSVLIITIIDIIFNLNTLQRWKWGYWSIDLIPATVMLLVLFIANTIIMQNRMLSRINKLEDALEQENEA